jgi:hypothetical protein
MTVILGPAALQQIIFIMTYKCQHHRDDASRIGVHWATKAGERQHGRGEVPRADCWWCILLCRYFLAKLLDELLAAKETVSYGS